MDALNPNSDLRSESLHFCDGIVPAVGQPVSILNSAIIPGLVTQVVGRDELLCTFLPFFLILCRIQKKKQGLGNTQRNTVEGRRLEDTPGTSGKQGSPNPPALSYIPLTGSPPRPLPEAEPNSSLGKGCFPSRRTKHCWRFQEGTEQSVHFGGLQPGFLDGHKQACTATRLIMRLLPPPHPSPVTRLALLRS